MAFVQRLWLSCTYLLNAVPFGTPHRINGEGNRTVSSVVIVLDIWTGDGRHSSLVFFSFLFLIIFNIHNFFVCVCLTKKVGGSSVCVRTGLNIA